jgi:hypothetical protein
MYTPASVTMAAALALVQGSPAAPAPQQLSTHNITLRYALTLLAIPLGHLDYSANFGGSRYVAEMHFRTGGLAAAFWQSRIDTSAEGRATPEALVPDVYTSQSSSRSGTHRSVRVDYSGKGAPTMIADPPYDLSRYPVTDAQKKGTVDPVTAISSIVSGLNTSERQPCGRTLAIFDGRRRYDIAFTLAPGKPEAVLGAGIHPRPCKGEYRHIAGLEQEVVDVSNVPAIYATFVDIPAGARHYTVAQTIWSSFLWGAVNAQLTEIRVDSRPLTIVQ